MRLKPFTSALAFGIALLSLGACSSNEPKNELPIVPDTRMTEYLEAQTRTANTVFGTIVSQAEPDRNILFSPFSFYTAASLLANGAEGAPLEELKSLLNVQSIEELNENNSRLMRNFRNLDSKVDLRVANSIWLSELYDVRPEFVGDLTRWYECGPMTSDFHTDAINGWVKDHTEGMIPTLFPENEELSGPMVLVNAMYFAGEWTTPFDPSATKLERFTSSDGSRTWTDMMHKTFESVRYSRTEREQILTLPFGNGCFSITFVLPAEGIAMPDYLAGASSDGFDMLYAAGEPRTVIVTLPKVKISDEYDLSGILRIMGLSEIFTLGDWPKVSDNVPVKVAGIPHGVAFEMDERGAKAAAATGVTVFTLPEPTVFRADRPFMFVITENSCNVPLFMGVVNTL